MATSYEDVKNHNLAQIDTNDDAHSGHDEKKDLHQTKTLSEIDLENKAAFKGDESDGAVDWTVRNILASIFLCMLYTGKPPHRPVCPRH